MTEAPKGAWYEWLWFRLGGGPPRGWTQHYSRDLSRWMVAPNVDLMREEPPGVVWLTGRNADYNKLTAFARADTHEIYISQGEESVPEARVMAALDEIREKARLRQIAQQTWAAHTLTRRPTPS
jgi:hypothetical protein